MLLLRAMATLRPFANTMEAFVVLAIGNKGELLGILVGMVVVIAALYGLAYLVNQKYASVERIRSVLCCTWAEAKDIKPYLDEIGVSWMKFYGWVRACECKLMPVALFSQGKDDHQFVATWTESRRAMLKLSSARQLDSTWDAMGAVGAVTVEIIKERQSKGNGIYMPTVELGED